MNPREKLLTALEIEPPLKKQMAIAGIICEMFSQCDIKAVIVGGSAVEFYTFAQYKTIDIDLIVTNSNAIKQIMEELGFKNQSGTWILPDDPTVVVEYPKGPLAGSYDKVQPIRMANGDIAYVIGLEDIIIDRTAAAKFWRDGSDEWAKYMVAARYDEIDWDYCTAAAKQAECLDELIDYKTWAENQRGYNSNAK